MILAFCAGAHTQAGGVSSARLDNAQCACAGLYLVAALLLGLGGRLRLLHAADLKGRHDINRGRAAGLRWHPSGSDMQFKAAKYSWKTQTEM